MKRAVLLRDRSRCTRVNFNNTALILLLVGQATSYIVIHATLMNSDSYQSCQEQMQSDLDRGWGSWGWSEELGLGLGFKAPRKLEKLKSHDNL